MGLVVRLVGAVSRRSLGPRGATGRVGVRWMCVGAGHARERGWKLPAVALGSAVGLVGLAAAYKQQSANVAECDAEKSKEGSKEMKDIRPDFEDLVLSMQDRICEAISELDGNKFRIDEWTRPNEAGRGRSCVLQDGNVFEKAGVNVSIVKGNLPKSAVQQMKSRGKELLGENLPFYATGISLVIHPKNPMAPTVHLNYRYFEVTDSASGQTIWWFGGGADLTPSYLFEEDAIEFHSSLKEQCDKHDPTFHARFKKWCDEYFTSPHRDGECRGIGGIFFDDLETRPALANPELDDRQALMAFSRDCLQSFIPTYVSIIERRKDMPFTEQQKEWQQLRRGRYVEFNLVHDRGTKFGLATPKNARIESILVSLPLTARWEYMHQVTPGSPEEKLVDVLMKPRDWAVDTGRLKEVPFEQLLVELAKRK